MSGGYTIRDTYDDSEGEEKRIMKEMKTDNRESEDKAPRELELPFSEEEFKHRVYREDAGDNKSEDDAAGSGGNEDSGAEVSNNEGDGAGVNDEDGGTGISDAEDSGAGTSEIEDSTDRISDAENDSIVNDLADDDYSEEDDDAAYETRRRVRMERIELRRRKRKRKKIATGILIAAAAAVIVTAVFYGDRLKLGLTSRTPVQGTSDKTDAVSGEGAAEGGKQNPEKSGGENQEKGGGNDDVKASQGNENPPEKAGGEHSALIADARLHAAQYDYDKAIELLKNDSAYSGNEEMQQVVKEFEEVKASCVSWPLEEVTHVFYHSLIVDKGKSFDGDYKEADYNQVMTTIDEFNKITQIMYDKGYVMVSLYDMAKANEDGTMTPGEILLPPGKIPFVLSQDDVSYYHYMEGDGYPAKLVVDENGKVRNEYVEDDGSVSVGDYDMVPLIDRFVEAHPDFSYRGAKGIIALTGYNGILGYRSDISYETRPDDLDANKVAWLDAHPDFSLEEEREGARKVAEAMKAQGWLFASHTWGHQNIADISLERLQGDTQRFKDNVDPIIGGTDIIIFAFGVDMAGHEDYSGDKFEFLKGQGYNYFCNVDSSKYSVQIRDRYLRQGRRNLDGYRMYYNPELLEDLFDVKEVFDPDRPVPVPPMG